MKKVLLLGVMLVALAGCKNESGHVIKLNNLQEDAYEKGESINTGTTINGCPLFVKKVQLYNSYYRIFYTKSNCPTKVTGVGYHEQVGKTSYTRTIGIDIN